MITKTYVRLVSRKEDIEKTPFIWDIEFKGAFSKYYEEKYSRWKEKQMKRLVRSGKARNMCDKFALLNDFGGCECATHLAFLGRYNFGSKGKGKKTDGNTELFYEVTSFMPILIIERFLLWREKNVQ